MKAPYLESEKLKYIPVSLDHISSDYVNWMNDPEVNRYLESGGDFSLEKLREFLTEVEKKDILFWAIHLKENDLHIGNIKIDPVNYGHGFGEYGIILGRRSEWGKGYAKEASRCIINFCFNEIGLRKVVLGVIADNIPAIKLYEQLGFLIEGIYIDHCIFHGKYCDVIRMAIFNSANYKYDQ